MRQRKILMPSLWRTCRGLANRQRLRILQRFIERGELSVSAIVDDTRTTASLASQYLRILNARGILQVRRSGREVLYRMEADPSVPHAAALVSTLRVTFRTRPQPTQEAFAALTGFTHPRRIALVRALAEGPLTLKALRMHTGISTPAALRHLRKLRRRGYVARTNTGYRCATPKSPLHRALLALALKG